MVVLGVNAPAPTPTPTRSSGDWWWVAVSGLKGGGR